MKKLLSIIASIAIIGSTAITVVACGEPNTQTSSDPKKMDLTEHLSAKMLGAFNHDDPTNDELLERLAVMNPDLKTSEIILTRNTATQADDEVIKNEATISVKEDSKIYHEGKHTIYFTDVSHPRLGLINVIKETHLGLLNLDYSFESPRVTELDVRNRLKELNPDLDINQLIVWFLTQDKTGGTIGLNLIDDNSYYHDKREDYYNLTYDLATEKRNLSEVVSQGDLGIASSSDLVLNDPDLMIQQGNHYIDFSQLITTERDLKKGYIRKTVLPNSEIYKPGHFDFTFQVEPVKKLSEVVEQKNLGNFTDEPTDQQILDKVKELNPNLKIEEIYISENTNNKVIIRQKFGSEFYWDEPVELTYQVTNYPTLQSIGNGIKNKFLGELDIQLDQRKGHELEILNNDLNKKIILDAVKQFNPWVVITELEVIFHRDGYATIKVIENVNAKIYYPGSIEVTFKNANLIALREVVISTDALAISLIGIDSLTDPLPDVELVKKAFYATQRKIDFNEINLEIISWVDNVEDDLGAYLSVKVNVNSDSNIYQANNDDAEYNLYVFKKGNFADKVVATDLGTFDYVPDFYDLSDRIYNLNNFMNQEILKTELMITNHINGEFDAAIYYPDYEFILGTVHFTYSVKATQDND